MKTSSDTSAFRLAAAGLRSAARLERACSFAAFVVLIVVVFADVAMRELSGSGLHWARQAGVYANLVVVMLGMGLASADGAHLRPRFADGWLPARWDVWLVPVQEWLMALFCAGVAVLATTVVLDSLAMQEKSAVLRIVVWPFQAVIPIAFALAALRHGVYGCFPQLRPQAARSVQGSA